MVLYKKSGNHTKNGVTIHIFPTKIGIRTRHKELTGKVNLSSNYVGDARTNTGVCQISLDKKSSVKEAMTGVDDSVEG